MKKDLEKVFDLVFKLAKADLTPAEIDDTRQVLSPLTNTEKLHLINIALNNQSLVLLHHHHKTHFSNIELPYSEEQLQFLESVHKTNTQRHEKINELLIKFDNKGMKLIILKGSLFSHLIYKNPYYKKMNDLDLLLSQKDENLGKTCLDELDYQSIGDIFDNFDMGGDSHHTPPYISHDLKCITGLHWGLNSKYSPFKINHEDIFKNIVPIELNGIKAWRMSWEDNLLHLCVHLPFYKTGIRELADVANLINKTEQEFDWEKFKKMVMTQNLADPVYRVLHLAQAMIYFKIPEDLNEYLNKNAFKYTKADTKKRIANTELLLASRCTHIAKIEKYFVVFKLATKFTEKIGALLKMYQLWFFCKTLEMKQIMGVLNIKTPFHYLVYRFIVPVLIWKAMARDHGNIPLAIVTFQNFLIGIRECLLFPLKKDGKTLKAHKFFGLLKALE